MSKKKATAISLPLSRTGKIMTSAVGVESVNHDIVALATKATEIFLMDFARRAYDQASEDAEFGSNSLEYDDIQKLVHSDQRYNFLIDTIPKRVKFSEASRLVEEKRLLDEELLRNLQQQQQARELLKQQKQQQQQQNLQATKPPQPPKQQPQPTPTKDASSVTDEVELLANSDS